jgi:predicted Zn-dependent protease
MKSRVYTNVFNVALLVLFTACSTVPIIGRKQVNFFPESDILAMSDQQYAEFLRTHPLETGTENEAVIQRVGQRLSSAVMMFLKENKLEDRVKDFKWDFKLVKSNEVNAWCMPGGKIVFYTGILPICKDEAGVATVMSHEIAHAVARHGNERMSQQMAVQLGGIALDVALSKKEAETRNIFNQAYGIGATVGFLLPYSRKHETEADKLGLIFLAMSDYDPNIAVPFWERMKALSKEAPPEFLSTHPSNDQRIKTIKEYIPTAMKYARKSHNRHQHQVTKAAQ